MLQIIRNLSNQEETFLFGKNLLAAIKEALLKQLIHDQKDISKKDSQKKPGQILKQRSGLDMTL